MARSRLRRSVAGIIALAAVLSACPSSDQPPPRSSALASPSIARGGSMTIAYPSEPPTLDPFAPGGDSTSTRDILQLLMPSFSASVSDAGREPELLEQAPVLQASGTAVTIRPDARWSDGRPITIADIRATWQRARTAPRSRLRSLYRRVVSIEAISEKSAVLRSRAGTDITALFSDGLGVLPAHRMRSATQRKTFARTFSVSGGPFVLTRWRRGLDMTFERNPNAFGSLIPALDRVRVVFVPDALGARAMFRAGRVDALGPYSAADQARHAAEIPGATVTSDQTATVSRLLVSTTNAPLREVAVRDALIRSFDRARIVRAFIGSEGTLATCGACERFDTKRSAAILDGARWRGRPIRTKTGRRLSLTIAVLAQDDLGAQMARAIQHQAALAGFDIQPIALEPDVFWRERLTGDEFDAAIVTMRGPIESGGMRSFDLAAMVVSLAAEAGLTLEAHAGPDGPFARVATWHR